jgi:pimeloyl-ACP methyl ester carboxylesterase
MRMTWGRLLGVSLCLITACRESASLGPAPVKAAAGAGGAAAGSSAAGRSAAAGASGASSAVDSAQCPVMVNDADCDKSRRPLVFIHGTVANGESFSHPALLLASNGYCADRIRAIEYNSLVALPCPDGGTSCPFMLNRDETYARAKAAVDAAIDQLRSETGADKVDLLGHSQGAGHGSRYAGENPDKVAHYIHLAGQQLESDPGGVPTLCLSSTGDAPRDCKTTKNVVFQDDKLDHAAVSSSTQAFVEMYKFLNEGAEPKYDSVQCGSPIMVEGRAPTFGDNTFLEKAEIDVFELKDNPYQRGAPIKNFELGPDGHFGPFEVKRGMYYEFKLTPPPGDTRKPRHAYMLPFTRSDRLVRLNFETTDPVASATGKQVNYNDNHAVVVVRRRQGAFLFGRDSLKVDGFEVLNEVNAKARMVIVGLYLYDKSLTDQPGPGDGMSSGESIISGTFVNSADVFMEARDMRFIEIEFGGNKLKVQNWPSARQGLSLVLVD